MGLNLIEQYDNRYILRLDKRNTCGLYGDKARIAYEISKGQKGIVTCGSRESIQTVAFAEVCDILNIPCDIHIPKGKNTDSILKLENTKCNIIREKVGYNNVLNAHARDNAKEKGYKFVRLGMLCDEAYTLIGQNVDLIIPYINDIKRIIIPVGSGTTLIGIANELYWRNINIPIVGVMCGMDATKNIIQNTFNDNIILIKSDVDYHTKQDIKFYGITLNPIYEGKCVPYIQDGDLFYIVA